MKQRVWRWMRRAMGYVPMTIPYCGRGWIALDERDLVQHHVIATGFYEPEVWETLFSAARKDEVVWDIGAHVGTFSIRSALDSRSKEVHAFEPDPLTRRTLEHNIGLNKNQAAVCTIHGLALGAHSGESILHRGPAENIGLSSTTFKVSENSITVGRQSVDELVFKLRFTPPTLMKIDVEGAEADILLGARRFLRECRPKAIVVEAEAQPDGAMKDRVIGELLSAAGYSTRWIQRPRGERWERENYLAVPSA